MPVPDEELSKEELKARKKEERKRKRREEKLEEVKKAKAAQHEGVDERAASDPRYRSKVFASMFLKPGQDDARMRKEFMSGISTKPLSQMSYL